MCFTLSAALEMLHNASLIHDDVVDETSLRRGRQTINSIWGNHLAVLVGDYFVSNALSAGIRLGNLEIIAALSDLGKELSLGEIDQICNARDHHFDEPSLHIHDQKKDRFPIHELRENGSGGCRSICRGICSTRELCRGSSGYVSR